MIHPHTKEAYELFHKGVLAFARAEQQGMRIDVEYCQRKKDHLTRKVERAKAHLVESEFVREWTGAVGKHKVNLNSNPQLSHFLYKTKKIQPAKFTTTGQGSTDEEALSQLGIPEVEKILEMRKLQKIRDTYLDAFVREQVSGAIHPFFNLHIAESFRSSSDRPNFQNIPKRDKEAMKICRSAIFPRLGHQTLSVDFGGIEVRVACCETKDEKLIYDVIHGDMHLDMAVECFMLDSLDKRHPGEGILRQGAKNSFVFPEFYGDYYLNCVHGLLKWAGTGYLKDDTPALVHLHDRKLIRLNKKGEITDYSKFTEHIKRIEDLFWNDRYKTYTAWKKRIWQRYQKNGYVDLMTGFRAGGVMKRNEVLNRPIQGPAFHCLLWSFIELDRLAYEVEKWDSKPVGQVHDEVTLDVLPEELDYIARSVKRVTCKDLPDAWDWIILPLEVDAGLAGVDESWADIKNFDLPED